MNGEFAYLRSKQYWALLLIWPPLKVFFAFSLFAALHVGLGLPWPTPDGAGLIASLLEMAGFIGLLLLLDVIAVALTYRLNIFRRDLRKKKQIFDPIGMFVGTFATTAGFSLLLATPFDSLHTGINEDQGGWIILLFLMMSGIHFPSLARQAERERADPDGGPVDDGADA